MINYKYITLSDGTHVQAVAIVDSDGNQVIPGALPLSNPVIETGTLTLDMDGNEQAMFEPEKSTGVPVIDTDFTLAFANASSGKLASMVVQLTGTRTITMPSDVLVSNPSSMGDWSAKPDLVIMAGTADIIEFEFLRYSLDSKWLLKIAEKAE
jgi:hypothetical protein